jgi:hypothetical protein
MDISQCCEEIMKNMNHNETVFSFICAGDATREFEIVFHLLREQIQISEVVLVDWLYGDTSEIVNLFGDIVPILRFETQFAKACGNIIAVNYQYVNDGLCESKEFIKTAQVHQMYETCSFTYKFGKL